ncbi:MAG: AraC family transcriptional regulator [Gammaproteobacteria bacterium]
MDALSDVLRIVRLTGGVFLDAEFTAPWCVTAKVAPEDCRPFLETPRHVIAYHCIVAGRLCLQTEEDEPIEVREGEIVLLARNDVHRIGSTPGMAPVSADDLVQAPKDGGLARIVHGGGGERTHIVCGFLGTDTPFNPLLATLPKVLKIDFRQAPSGSWVESSFMLAANEIAAGRAGAVTLVSKLSELLFVEAVRQYVAALPAEQRGWLAGLRDPIVARALSLLHSRPNGPWTAEDLAREVGLSRSAFADRFTTLIGEPPMQYLAAWRMQLAAQRLREGRASVSQVAHEVGYESEAAFNRAFKREFGTPPATWRRKAR